MSESSSEAYKKHPGGFGFLSGLAFALVCTFVFVKTGNTWPKWIRPVKTLQRQIQNNIVSGVASASANASNPQQVQRAVAVLIGNSHSDYIETDNSLGQLVTEEFIWRNMYRDDLKRFMQIQRTTVAAMRRELPKYPALEENILSRYGGYDQWLKSVKEELPGGRWMMKRLRARFPDATDNEIAEKMGTMTFEEIVHVPTSSWLPACFRLASRDPAANPGPVEYDVTVHIEDDGKQRIKTLFKQTLPPGVFALYWDGTSDSEYDVRDRHYFYVVTCNGQVIRREVLHNRKRLGIQNPDDE